MNLEDWKTLLLLNIIGMESALDPTSSVGRYQFESAPVKRHFIEL